MEATYQYTGVLRSLINLIGIAGRFRLADEPLTIKKMDITDHDIKMLLSSLNKHNVKYLLVGGFAVNIHGYHRTTNDLNLWIKEEDKNMDNLIKALIEIDIPGVELLRGNKLVPGFTELSFGDKNFKIDLMNYLKAFREADFDKVYNRSVLGQFEDVHFRVIHKKDLIKEKKAAARHKDLDDLEHLTADA